MLQKNYYDNMILPRFVPRHDTSSLLTRLIVLHPEKKIEFLGTIKKPLVVAYRKDLLPAVSKMLQWQCSYMDRVIDYLITQ
jgi:hypothetical protein